MEKGTPSPMGVGKKTKRTRAQMAPDVEMEQTEQQTGMATPVPSTSKGCNKGEEFRTDREAASSANPKLKERERDIERVLSRVADRERESERMTRNISFVEYDEVWGFDDPPLGFPGYALHLKAYTDREKGIPSQIEEKDLPAFFERMRLRSISRRLRGIPE
jgi:hypothetical protein